jgi:diguanylate cyclase (GGDEF)-like protein
VIAIPEPRTIKRLTPVLLLYLGIYLLWQIERWGPASAQPAIGDLFFVPVCGAAAWSAWSASCRAGGSPRLRRAWRFLALAAVAYLLGDVAQTVDEAASVQVSASLEDPLYLCFYPLMLAGLLSFPTRHRTAGERLRLWLDLAVVALGGSGIVVYLVLGPTAIASHGTLTSAASIAYPVGDMILLVGLGSLLLRGSARSARRPLHLLAGMLGLYVVADLVYSYSELHGGYVGGDRVDVLWLTALGLMALAASVQGGVAAPEEILPSTATPTWLPYAGALSGFAVLLISVRHDPLFPGLTMTVIAIVLVVLVCTRQVLAQRDLVGAQGVIRHQTLHDGLTGLPNRLLVIDRVDHLLTRAQRTGWPVSVLFIDLDGFKQVNETFGHTVGDELLRIVAGRLSGVVRIGETVGRLGGDEFVVVLDPDGGPVPAELVAERVLSALRDPFSLRHLDVRSLTITASVGIASATRSSAENLLRDADIALHCAKTEGRDRFVVFESAMHTVVEGRLWFEMDLIEGIEQRQFFLDYQPTFDLRNGQMRGVEALLRWRHPSRGVVFPSEFIPVAEQTGLIVALGRWALEEACIQVAEWHARGSTLQVAVNVSGRQLDDPCFVDDVARVLESTGLDPGSLTVEITETILMRDPVAAARVLGELKGLGVRLAVDDFGTGYSSLAYLRQFPVDTLKIDRSFVSGSATSKQAAALVHTLVELGKRLGLETVGEGIETEAQLQHLRREGCDIGQGFLLGRPVDASGIERILRARDGHLASASRQ